MNRKLSCAIRGIVGAGALCLSLAAGATNVDVYVNDITEVNANAYSGNLDVNYDGVIVDTIPFMVSRNGAGVITIQSPGSHWIPPISKTVGVVQSGGSSPPPGGGDWPPIRPNFNPVWFWGPVAVCAAGVVIAVGAQEFACRNSSIQSYHIGKCGFAGVGAGAVCFDPEPDPPEPPEPGDGGSGGGGGGGGGGAGSGGGTWSIAGSTDVDTVTGTVTVGDISEE